MIDKLINKRSNGIINFIHIFLPPPRNQSRGHTITSDRWRWRREKEKSFIRSKIVYPPSLSYSSDALLNVQRVRVARIFPGTNFPAMQSCAKLENISFSFTRVSPQHNMSAAYLFFLSFFIHINFTLSERFERDRSAFEPALATCNLQVSRKKGRKIEGDRILIDYGLYSLLIKISHDFLSTRWNIFSLSLSRFLSFVDFFHRYLIDNSYKYYRFYLTVNYRMIMDEDISSRSV